MLDDTRKINTDIAAFIGFQTAGGSRVTVAKESVDRVKNMFDDIPSETNNATNSISFQSATGRQITAAQEIIDTVKTIPIQKDKGTYILTKIKMTERIAQFPMATLLPLLRMPHRAKRSVVFKLLVVQLWECVKMLLAQAVKIS